jgi:hypothetical protein
MEIYIKSLVSIPKSKNKAVRMPFLILVSKSKKNAGPIIILSISPVTTALKINSANRSIFGYITNIVDYFESLVLPVYFSSVLKPISKPIDKSDLWILFT